MRCDGIIARAAMCGVLAGTLGLDASPPPTLSQSQSPSLSLATVRANIDAAYGKAPQAERVVTNFTRFGLDGSTVELRSGRDYRVDETFGPFHTSGGRVAGRSWSVNDNGELVDQPPRENRGDSVGALGAEDRTVTLEHEGAPAERYVIARLTPLGFGTKDYVDPVTWHIVRRDTIAPGATTTTLYDDFRTTGGRTRPWHVTSSDGHPENDATSTIASIDVGPIASDRFAIPTNLPPFITFPAGAKQVQVPVAFDHEQNKFVVHVEIGGHVLPFLLDSGASGIVIEQATVTGLGLKTYGRFSNGVNAGRYVGTRTIAPAMNVGPLAMHDVEMNVVPSLVGKTSGPYAVVGLLGFDFFDATVLALDYEHGTVFASPPDGYMFPGGEHMIDLDLRFESGLAQTALTIDGARGESFFLDTGGAGAVLVTDLFRRHNPAIVDDSPAGSATLSGVGGTFGAQAVKLRTITLGNVTFTDFPALIVSEAKVFAGAGDGLVGPDLFRLFTVYFDYSTRQVRLIPNSAGSAGIQPQKR